MKVIAIDGPAGSGKSTIARAVADRLGLEYLDTGAMYRAATWAVLDEGGDPADEEDAVSATLARPIRLGGELGVGRVRVGTVDVTQAIRGPEVSAAVSVVSAHPGVRAILRERQRDWALGRGGGVVEGRDIGTVVFPDAQLKVFLTARPEVRARRRAGEVGATDEATIAEWAGNIAERDRIDSGRADSPLVEADDSWVLDTSDLSIAEVVERIVERARMNRDDVMVRPPAWARGVNGAIRALAGFLGRIYLRMEVIGTERIPASGGFVFAPTHRSNIDFLLAGLASPRRVRWMAKHTIFKGGLIDRFLVNMGAFPVNRDTADRNALDICERLIEHGEVVVMFPEGRRKDGDRVEDVFRGPAFVSARRRVPIVPMGIGGSDAAMPIGKKMVRPRKVVMIIGEPIYPDVPLEGRVSRVMIDATTERLTDSLQRLYDEARTRAAGG